MRALASGPTSGREHRSGERLYRAAPGTEQTGNITGPLHSPSRIPVRQPARLHSPRCLRRNPPCRCVRGADPSRGHTGSPGGDAPMAG